MDYKHHEHNGKILTEVISDDIILSNSQDFLDIVGECGSNYVVINKRNISDAFFDLKTCVAGDILQKASNYNIYLGIVGDFSEVKSKSLRDFIFESNRTRKHVFKDTLEAVFDAFM